MAIEALAPHLSKSLQDVLESMCFTTIDGIAGQEVQLSAPRIEVTLNFHGSLEGRLWLSIPSHTAADFTAAFSGSTSPDRIQTIQLAGELANMVCGATLSRLAEDGSFDLESPCPRWVTEDHEPGVPGVPDDRLSFQVGAAIVSAAMTLSL